MSENKFILKVVEYYCFWYNIFRSNIERRYKMSTPHIESNKENIAKTVLMPGDPLRAKYIAFKYLENVKLVNQVRNMLAYTGTYKGKEITIFASGMGNPSMGIYSYELYKYYDVENIIRIGTAGAYTKELDVRDLLVVSDVYSLSSYAKEQNNSQEHIIEATPVLLNQIEQVANKLSQKIKKGRVHCEDSLYKENSVFEKMANEHNCLAVEMESFALFHNAKILNKKAACILTISNSLVSNIETTSEEREKGLDEMIILALETAITLS